MMKVALDIKILKIIILGDYADMYCISSHGPKHPNMPSLLKREIQSVRREIKFIEKSFSKAHLIFLEGNHSFRLEKYVRANAKELYGILRLPELFEMDKSRWEYVPYTPSQKVKVARGLYARHEPLSTSSAQATANKALTSLIYGHVHRQEEAHVVGLDGKTHSAFSPGWLGDKRSEAFQYVKHHHQWQLGFGLVHDYGNNWFYECVRINPDMTCLVNGKVYKL